MANADRLVRLQGVTKDYPKVSKGGDRLRALFTLLATKRQPLSFRALDAIDLEVKRGESVGVIGENGAGKSTLLKIVAGVLRPTAGSVEVSGRVSALLELGSGFHPDFTGRENIALSGALAGMSPRELAAKVQSIIEFADLGEHIDEPIKHYSSGMVVRLGFAVATALEPDLLITDEVLAVGDVSFQKKCIAWLERYRASGGTFLLCSHSMYHIQTLCSRAIWIHHGAARLQGDPFDVTREYLAYHEAKMLEEPPSGRAPSHLTRIESFWIEDAEGNPATSFAMGGTAVVRGIAYEPDDRAPVVLVAIVRINGTGVCGLHSNDFAYAPTRLTPQRFGFGVQFPNLELLPGKYLFRAHALDPEGLRLFDTVAMEITVTGEARDYGVVRLAHRWLPGKERASATAHGQPNQAVSDV